MSADLIDERVSLDQCKRAIEALHAHQKARDAEREDTELLGAKEPAVWLNVAVKKIPAQQKVMPVRIPIKHPLVDPRTTGVCLITKDPQREYKDLLESKNIKFVSKVIGISKLKGKFKPFEARRILLKEHGMFLADDRVIPLLPKLLGGKWFDAKKQPIPVTLTRTDLKKELEHAISSSYMHQNRGTNTSIKIGTMSQTPAQILANLQTALPVIGAKISGGWANVQALSIKTNASVALPIWSCALDVDGRFAEVVIAGDKSKSKKKGEKAEVEEKKEEEKKGAGEKRKREEKEKAAPATPEKKQKVEAAPATKEKKGKKAAAGAAAAAPVVESPAPKEKATESPAPKSKKEKGKKAAPVAPVVESPAEPTPPKEKKKGKKAAAVPEPMEVDATEEAEEEAPPPKKKSKKVLAAEAAAAAEEKSTPKSPAPAVTEKAEKKKALAPKSPAAEKKVPKSPAVEKKKPAAKPESPVVEKAEKKKAPAEKVSKAAAPAPSAEELKAKKAAAPGEKKKEKVAKGGKGKSAKEGVIGKKGLSR
ncbi:ribosomal protein L1 [Cylindrobasidium torrendii FP15055 ss-10]|uniref:Ribosomal L1 domain-containing protein 1 n=1 Tax=Cylindrobasidium torrendii FP15055 ss-10 TaxID=1314674 RepID=A0A0D7B0W5_9AGAR|nr:ribosomal protein L1 [Cylindrobasidium torrendii FP15055 ss-10]